MSELYKESSSSGRREDVVRWDVNEDQSAGGHGVPMSGFGTLSRVRARIYILPDGPVAHFELPRHSQRLESFLGSGFATRNGVV